MHVVLLCILDDGDFRHGEGEPVFKLLLDRVKLVSVLGGPPHLAHAILTGIQNRHEDTDKMFAASFLSVVLVFIFFHLRGKICN